jgi:hypothetical protein
MTGYGIISNVGFSNKNTMITRNKIIVNNLPNLGREAHTYLTYCINNYDNLPDFVTFLQGTPHHGINSSTIKDWMDSIDKNFAHCTNNYKSGNMDWFLEEGRIVEWAGPINQSQYDVKEWAKVYIREGLKEENYPIFWNACFGVSKKAILSNPVEKYDKIIKEELQTPNSESAHYLERLWYYLFNLDSLDK